MLESVKTTSVISWELVSNILAPIVFYSWQIQCKNKESNGIEI